MTSVQSFLEKQRVGWSAVTLACVASLTCSAPVMRGQGHATAAAKTIPAKATGATAPAAMSADERIQKIEATAVDIPTGDKEPLRLSLAQLMELYKVPALSIAVIDDFKIAWAKGYGMIGAGSNAPVTTKTLFQAGSISKPVAATGALYLVEQGKLSIDEDVNVKLKRWKVPESEFTKEQKVTLRRLMSHTGGLTVHGFPGYDVDAPVPTLVQIFNGEKPANTAPLRVDVVPGTLERYSGGGVTIEQQLMMDVTGKAFPELMREIVLDKIGMTDSSYEQPLPASRAAMTAIGAYGDGKPVQGKWHIYPEIAAANYVLRRVAQEYAWNYNFEGEMPALVIIARARGTQAALDRYAELRESGALEGEHAEGSLNQLGYTLLYSGHEKEAITVFQENVQEFPKSSNVYDSLGEAYAKVGEKDLAIANYEKSLQLNPKNQNAVERLKKLREAK